MYKTLKNEDPNPKCIKLSSKAYFWEKILYQTPSKETTCIFSLRNIRIPQR